MTLREVAKWPFHKWLVLSGSLLTLPYKFEQAFYWWQVSTIERFPEKPAALLEPRIELALALAEGHEDALQREAFDGVPIANGIWAAVRTVARTRKATHCGPSLEWQLSWQLMHSENEPFRALSAAFRRLVWAEWIVRNLTPREALALWASNAWFGPDAIGVEAAARTYFGRPSDALSLGQVAALASLPASPNRYNPCRHPDRSTARRDYVLRRLEETGTFGPFELWAAHDTPITAGLRCRMPPPPREDVDVEDD